MAGPGFEVRPEGLRAVAAGLRDDAGRVATIGPVIDDALAALAGVGGPLGAAARELADAHRRALGDVRGEVEQHAQSLELGAAEHLADDRGTAAAFGGPTTAKPP